MNTLMIFSSILAVAFARPGYFLSPYDATLTAPFTITKLVSGAPTGLDGRVVDTPEVALAKAEHALAHINERITIANEAVKTSAPVGQGGQVVDTPEVAIAKAVHTAAHLNEKSILVSGASNPNYDVPVLVSAYSSPVIYKYLI